MMITQIRVKKTNGEIRIKKAEIEGKNCYTASGPSALL